MTTTIMNQYFIANIWQTTSHHEHILWWKPERNGYTACIKTAGLYSEAEARSICNGGICIAVPQDVAIGQTRSTPYYRRQDGTLDKLYDGGPHRVVPNSKAAWQHLMSGRLHGCAHPSSKPEPINTRMARSIYLDGIELEPAE